MADAPSSTFANPNHTPATASSDPFVDHSVRRTSNRGSLAALMAAIQQAVPQPPSPVARQRASMAVHNPPRRGQCTHITMHRLHGNYICQMCGHPPELGWLYVCRQDWLIAHQDSVATKAESAIVVPDESNYFDVMARYASSIKMSPSVVKQIQTGLYTFDQIEKLVAQKEHLISTIEGLEGLSTSTESTPASHRTSTLPSHAISNIVASVGAKAPSSLPDGDRSVVHQRSDSQQQTSPSENTPESAHKQPPTKLDSCNYMICHTCRPFLNDRLYVNIGSVLDDSQPPLTEEEARNLPMMHPRIVRKFGLPKATQTASPSPRRLQRSQSVDITLLQRGDSNYEYDTPLDWTTSSTTSSSYDDELGELRTQDPYPCPGPGVCPVYSRNSGCAYDSQDFYDVQRVHAHRFGTDAASTAEHRTPNRPLPRLRPISRSASGSPARTSSNSSSISLPTPTSLPLDPETPVTPGFGDDSASKSRMPKPGKAATVCGVLSPSMDFTNARLSIGTDFSGKDSHDSFGSEIEVDGGVALTEEAVSSGLPDIST